MNATTPIFSVILAHFLTREERLTANRLFGVLLGWTGAAVLLGVESLAGQAHQRPALNHKQGQPTPRGPAHGKGAPGPGPFIQGLGPGGCNILTVSGL